MSFRVKMSMNQYKFIGLPVICVCICMAGCSIPNVVQRAENKSVPAAYAGNGDSSNVAAIPWRSFFTDRNLTDLIDTALKNNQELSMTLQEIEIARNEVRIRKRCASAHGRGARRHWR